MGIQSLLYFQFFPLSRSDADICSSRRWSHVRRVLRQPVLPAADAAAPAALRGGLLVPPAGAAAPAGVVR